MRCLNEGIALESQNSSHLEANTGRLHAILEITPYGILHGCDVVVSISDIGG